MDRIRKGINAYQSVSNSKKGNQDKNDSGQPAKVQQAKVQQAKVQQIVFPQLKPQKKKKKIQGLSDEQLAEALLKTSASPVERISSGSRPAAPLSSSSASQSSQSRAPEVSPGLIKIVKSGNKAKRVAKFLLLIGKDEAAKVLKLLPEEQVEEILREVTLIRRIEKSEAQAILDEFGYLTRKYSGDFGGVEAAERILIAAFGAEKAGDIIQKAIPEEKKVPFQFLNELDHHQLLILLKDESFQAIGVVLPHLQAQLASKVLAGLPEHVRLQVIRHVAKAEEVAPEIITGIERVLRDRIRTQGKVDSNKVNGQDILVDILKNMDFIGGEKLLEELEEDSPEMARSLKEKLFTMDVLFRIPDLQLQILLRDYSEQELAVILKGKTGEVRNRILNNLSERRRLFIQEESAHLGPMRRSDVDKATLEFLSYVRQQYQNGEIQILHEREEYI